MLVLTRKLNESIMIGDDIEVMVLDVHEGFVKLGIKAPRAIQVHRQEVFAEIRAENLRAQQPEPQSLATAAEALSKAKPRTRRQKTGD